MNKRKNLFLFCLVLVNSLINIYCRFNSRVGLALLQDQAITDSLISSAEKLKAICGLTDKELFTSGTSVNICFFNNSQNLKQFYRDIESITQIKISSNYTAIRTDSLFDKETQTNLLIALLTSYTENEISTTLDEVLCTNYIYLDYIRAVDYFTTRIKEKKKCDTCAEMDQEATQKIIYVYNIFNNAFFNEQQKLGASKTASVVIEKVTIEEQNVILSFLTALRNLLELDSGKPSASNQDDCMSNLSGYYIKDEKAFDFKTLKNKISELVSKYITTDPITDYQPSS